MKSQLSIGAFEVFANGLDHPECCAFDRDGNLWAGGEAGQIYRIDPDGKVFTVANVGGFCSGLALAPDDRELFVCVSGVGVVRVTKDGEYRVFAAHAADHRIVTPNFPLFDRQGRMYLSDSGHWMKRDGFLLRFDNKGLGQVIAGPLGYVNGLALSADERHLYVVESDRDAVLRFDIPTDGSIGPAEAGILPAPEVYTVGVGRFPDGIAIDVEGNLYACCYASDEIWRIDPDRRQTLVAHDRWGIRLGRPTNLAFGGPEFDEIFVANLGRTTITHARLGVRGLPPQNLRTTA